jgi:DedD protein
MARPISDQELQLKKRARRRLVGAVVLVSAVAVLLPMVLDSEPKPASRKVDIHIPPSDSAAPKSSTNPASSGVKESAPKSASAPQGESSTIVAGSQPSGTEAAPPLSKAEAPAPIAEPASTAPIAVPPPLASAAPQAEAVKSRPAETKAAPVTAARDATKAAARDEKGTLKDAANGTFVVQVAALADAARVKQLQKQMTSAGVKTYTEVVSTKAGDVTRVRAGPYSSREAAEKARTQLKKVGLDGKVVSR